MRTLLLVGIALSFACSGRAPPSGPLETTSPSANPLRDEARLVLERQCGECHLPDSAGARPGALAVFDLSEPEWARGMTAEQLRSAQFRLEQPLDENAARRRVPEADRDLFARFVRLELALRGSPPLL